MVPAPADPLFLKQALDDAIGASPDDAPQQALVFYRFALQQTWVHMARVIGPLGAKTIFEHAVRSSARACPDLRAVVVTNEGIDLSALPSDGVSSVPPAHLCLEGLCISAFQTLGELTGNVVLGPLLERLKDWESGDARDPRKPAATD